MKVLDYIDSESNLTFDRIREFEGLLNTPAVKDKTHTVKVPPAYALAYKNDFYGLMKHYFHIEPELFYFLLRINGYYNPLEYNGKTELKIPETEIFNLILMLIKDKENIT